MRSAVRILTSALFVLSIGAMSCSDAATQAIIDSVALSLPDSLTNLTVGQTAQIGAEVRQAGGALLDGQTITWTSSVPGVATVSSTGVVTAVSPGIAVITGSASGHSGSVTVTVRTPVTQIVDVSFEGYTNTAAMIADCSTFYCPEQDLTDAGAGAGVLAGDMSLDATANPPGGTKAMRYHYLHPGDGCNSITLRRSIRFKARQEVWAEFNIKWSSNFTTRNDKCPPNDHKLIFGDTQADANGRWAFYVGSDAGAFHNIKGQIPLQPGIPDGQFYLNKNLDGSAGQILAESLWDGKWHTLRFHMRNSTTISSADGAFQIWIDGVLKHDQRGFNIYRADGTNNPDLIEGFSFAHNKDDGPPGVDMYIWWGAIRVFSGDPGWK